MAMADVLMNPASLKYCYAREARLARNWSFGNHIRATEDAVSRNPSMGDKDPYMHAYEIMSGGWIEMIPRDGGVHRVY